MAIDFIDGSENFKKEIESGKKMVVNFYADWCGPCKMFAPALEAFSNESDVKVVKINIDNNKELAKEHGVSSIPTTIFFNNKAETDRVVGMMPKEEIQKRV